MQVCARNNIKKQVVLRCGHTNFVYFRAKPPRRPVRRPLLLLAVLARAPSSALSLSPLLASPSPSPSSALACVPLAPRPLRPPTTTTAIAAVDDHHRRCRTFDDDDRQKPAVVVCHRRRQWRSSSSNVLRRCTPCPHPRALVRPHPLALAGLALALAPSSALACVHLAPRRRR